MASGCRCRWTPHEAIFVVFRKPTAAAAWTARTVQRTTVASLDGAWRVSFEPGRGAPPAATFDRLISWPESSDPGIKYFSGAATYRMDVTAPRDWLASGRRIELDLGDVRELAVVSVNGTRVATAWRPPYTVDITGALKKGTNRLEIEVVNLWPNRLIGDQQPGAKPIAFAPMSPYQASSALLPSGLLGPVKIVAVDAAASVITPADSCETDRPGILCYLDPNPTRRAMPTSRSGSAVDRIVRRRERRGRGAYHRAAGPEPQRCQIRRLRRSSPS